MGSFLLKSKENLLWKKYSCGKLQRSTSLADIKKNQSAYDDTCSLPGLQEHVKKMGG
jgi:hypothetical protein